MHRFAVPCQISSATTDPDERNADGATAFAGRTGSIVAQPGSGEYGSAGHGQRAREGERAYFQICRANQHCSSLHIFPYFNFGVREKAAKVNNADLRIGYAVHSA